MILRYEKKLPIAALMFQRQDEKRSNHMKRMEPIFSLALEYHIQGYTFTCHKQEPQQRIF